MRISYYDDLLMQLYTQYLILGYIDLLLFIALNQIK